MDPSALSADQAKVILEEIGAWKTQTVAMVFGAMTLIVLAWLWLRHRDAQAARKAAADTEKYKERRANRLADTLSSLEQAVVKFDASSEQQAMQQAAFHQQLMDAHRELADAVRVQNALARGAISPMASRELIERELEILCRDVVHAYQVSLRANHYRNYEDEIRDKMRRAVAEMLDRMMQQLGRFDLSVKTSSYVPMTEDGKRYPLVDKLWDAMTPYYKAPIDYRNEPLGAERNAAVRQTIRALFRDEIKDGQRRADEAYQVREALPHPEKTWRVESSSSIRPRAMDDRESGPTPALP